MLNSIQCSNSNNFQNYYNIHRTNNRRHYYIIQNYFPFHIFNNSFQPFRQQVKACWLSFSFHLLLTFQSAIKLSLHYWADSSRNQINSDFGATIPYSFNSTTAEYLGTSLLKPRFSWRLFCNIPDVFFPSESVIMAAKSESSDFRNNRPTIIFKELSEKKFK